MAARIFRSLEPNVATVLLEPRQWAVIAGSWAIAILMPNVARMFRYVFTAESARWGSLPAIPMPGVPITVASGVALAISVAFLLSGQVNAFIYFQF